MSGDRIDIALAAADRWAAREPRRKKNEGLTPTEIEPPERVQKRLDRLQQVSLREAAIAPGEAELAELRGAPSALERTIGDRDFLSIAFVEHAQAVARFVGRVIIRSQPGANSGFGTGFMVSPRLLMTNNHVLRDEQVASHSEVEFDFQRDRFNRMMPSVYFKLEPQTFFLTDRALDFTLVAVAERSRDGGTLNPYGWSRLIAEEGKALIGDPLNIIQHPRGEHKQIVVRSNKLVDLYETYAHYTTDTEQGSSGSPVYNDQWEVVALHHSGVPKRNEAGELVKRNGEPWRQGRDAPDELVWIANEGIRISSIVRHVERAPLPPSWSPLRSELLELAPPDPMEGIRKELEAARRLGSGGGREAGSVSVTVPLKITVSLGDPADGIAVAAATAPPPLPPPPPPPPPPRAAAAEGPAAARPAALREALAELREADNRPYYDRAADARKRDAYWASIAGHDLPPGEMFDAVSALLRRTHVRPLSYQPSRYLYPWVDLHPGTPHLLESIYSGQRFDPAQVIEEDFRSETAFAEAQLRLEGALDEAALEATLAALEAQLPYNCEHVVPQSWFERKEPMRGDLHHLFTCESRCNSFRGNTPYFDFTDFEEVTRDLCGKRETEKFEPEAGKGPVARATFYFLLRYPGEIERRPDQYDETRLEMLLKWHEADPVDEYERHRNAAVEEKQGNRNPLIDFPDWSSRIDFARGLGAAPQ